MAKMFNIQVEMAYSQYVEISDNGHKLWLKWNESQDDDDWETFVDYVADEIADQLAFYIEEAEPIG